jgi:hypothetical protein
MSRQLVGETCLFRADDLGFPVGRRHEAIHIEPSTALAEKSFPVIRPWFCDIGTK